MSNALTAKTATPPSAVGFGNKGVQLTTMVEAMEFARAVIDSGLAPKDFRTAAQVVVAIQCGAELGIPPMQSLQSIAVINGRPSLWGDAALAIANSSGLVKNVEETITGETEDAVATCTVTRVDGRVTQRSFSWQDALTAGLPGRNPQYKSYPRRMLQMRARGFALRDSVPEALRGMVIREEAQDYIGPDNARDVTPPAACDPIMAALVDAPAEIPAEVEIIPPRPAATLKASFTVVNPETGETTDYPRNPGGMKQAVGALQEAITAVAGQPDQMARWATANSAMLEDAIAAATAKGMPESNITLQNARSILDLAAPANTEPSNVE